MNSINLARPAAWRRLGRAYRTAHAIDVRAMDAHTDAERAAYEDPDMWDTPPHETHGDALARVRHNDAIRERHGVRTTDARLSVTSTRRFALVHAALDAPAPDLAALSLKLEMVADDGGWNDFNSDTWLIFVGDLQRLCGLSIQQPESCQ